MNSIPADLLLPSFVFSEHFSPLSQTRWVLLWLCITQIHVVTVKRVSEVSLGTLCVSCHTLWLTPWLIVQATAITAGLHLIFGSPTSASVCLWSARDVVRWIRWRGEMSDKQSRRLKAQRVFVCVSSVVLSLYPGEGWTLVGLRAFTRVLSVVFTLPTQQAGSQCISEPNS